MNNNNQHQKEYEKIINEISSYKCKGSRCEIFQACLIAIIDSQKNNLIDKV